MKHKHLVCLKVNFAGIQLSAFKVSERMSVLTDSGGFTLWFAAQTSI